MKRLLGTLWIFVALAVAGCEAVFTEGPLGDEVVKLDSATWQGTWLGDEVVMLTTVLDSEQGQLQAAWMERGSSGASFEIVAGSVRRTGEIMYLSMEHEPITGADAGENAAEETARHIQKIPEFLWARIENDGRRAVMWWPDVEQTRLAVAEGRLPGIIKDDQDVILGQLDPSHLQLINEPASKLLRWSQPVAFIRIGD